MQIHNRPLPARIHESLRNFRPKGSSAYVFGTSVEDRSSRPNWWLDQADDVRFVPIERQTRATFEATTTTDATVRAVRLRSVADLAAFWAAVAADTVYLDITGLAHHIWAPLVRAFPSGRSLIVTYLEPADYRFSLRPTQQQIFDLSERIQGISPIPGFASLGQDADDSTCFVPLLGFEGVRLAYIIEHVQPLGNQIFPVVGVPGFRAEYPFHAYHGNHQVLSETRSWTNVYFALASCPFSLYFTLEELAERNARPLVVAPIGTKPHALGAILFKLYSRHPAEIVYDHPVRKADRTQGTARLHEYFVSLFRDTRT